MTFSEVQRLTPAFCDPHLGVAVFEGIIIRADSIDACRPDAVGPTTEVHFRVMPKLARLVSERPGALVLDVGTGSGVYAIWAAKLGCRVLALDSNSRSIWMARANAAANQIPLRSDPGDLLAGEICFCQQSFDEQFSHPGPFDIVILTPPCMPTLSHAGVTSGDWINPLTWAGEDGQAAFCRQVFVASRYLTTSGVCCAVQLSMVTAAGAAREEMAVAFKSAAVSQFHLLGGSVDAKVFLRRIYDRYFGQSVEEFISHWPSRFSRLLTLVYLETSRISNAVASELPNEVGMTSAWDEFAAAGRNSVDFYRHLNSMPASSVFVHDLCSAIPSPGVGQGLSVGSGEEGRLRSMVTAALEWLGRSHALEGGARALVDVVIVDTSPWYPHDVEQAKRLNQEVALACSEDFEDIEDNLFAAFQHHVSASLSANIGIYYHPTFMAATEPRHWGSVHSSHLNRPDEPPFTVTGVEQELFRRLSRTYDERYHTDSKLYSDDADYLRFLSEKKGFPIERRERTRRFPRYIYSFYGITKLNDLKRVEEHRDGMNQRIGVMGGLKSEARWQIRDLHLCLLAQHHGLRKRLETLAGGERTFLSSRLTAVPLTTSPLPAAEWRTGEVPETYRGGLWVWAFTRANWTQAHESWLESFVRFLWLLFNGEYNFDAAQSIQEEFRKKGMHSLLHQLAKDINVLSSDLDSYEKRLKQVSRQLPPSVELPEFRKPDELAVSLMFVTAANRGYLQEMPEECSSLLRGEWNREVIDAFVDRIVWPQASSRAVSVPEIKALLNARLISWRTSRDRDEKYPRPVCEIKTIFQLRHAVGVYPLVLLVLRSAYHHAYLRTLLEYREIRPGQVEIEYRRLGDDGEEIEIRNSGLALEDGRVTRQSGWEDDLSIMNPRITGGWEIDRGPSSRFSEYRNNMWTTVIRFKAQGVPE